MRIQIHNITTNQIQHEDEPREHRLTMSQSIQCNMRKNHKNKDKQCHYQTNATWGRTIGTQINNVTINPMQKRKKQKNADKHCHNQYNATWWRPMRVQINNATINPIQHEEEPVRTQINNITINPMQHEEEPQEQRQTMSLSNQCNMRKNHKNTDNYCHNQYNTTWGRDTRTQINNVTINPMQHEEEPLEHR